MPTPTFYVTNSGNGASNKGSISVFAAGANGNATPAKTISGSNTDLSAPSGIALDQNTNIYVTNFAPADTVAVFAAGASGNATPIQFISGPNDGLSGALGIAVDRNDKTYVANAYGNTVTVYAAGATGNAAPIQTIAGAQTHLSGPTGIAVDGSDRIYVANTGPGSNSGDGKVTVFAAGANGNVAPIEVISGRKTKLFDPYGLARDASGNIYVANIRSIANADDGNLEDFSAGSSGNVSPLVRIHGGRTKVDGPIGIAIR